MDDTKNMCEKCTIRAVHERLFDVCWKDWTYCPCSCEYKRIMREGRNEDIGTEGREYGN